MAQPSPLDVNLVLEQMSRLLQRLVGEDVALDLRLGADAQPVVADQGQIEQIVINLAVNARDACRPGDRVTISTETVTLSPEVCRGRVNARPGTFVCLTVADTGRGMDAHVREHLFEPFFSTKPDGSGLGLAVVYGLVQQHEGWIEVESAPDQGSTFRLYLPSDDGAASATPRGLGGQIAHPGRNERLLLVEDEEGVRRMAARLLRRNGYVVVEAASAEEALDLHTHDKEGFDLVFSDVVLTGQSGVELAGELLAPRPAAGDAHQRLRRSEVSVAGHSRPRLRLSSKPYRWPSYCACYVRCGSATPPADPPEPRPKPEPGPEPGSRPSRYTQYRP
jgi:CheY-like chemotaxis protein